MANNKIKLKKNNKKEEEEHLSTWKNIKHRKLKISNNWTHQQARVTFDAQDVLTISILTVMITPISQSINHDSFSK